jgi:hypothetical protein
MFTTEIDQTTASAAVRRLIEARVGDRADRVQRVISELHALSDMEHELVEDSLIDPFVTCLRIGPAERFSLGPRGHLVLASAFHSDSTSATLPEGFAEGLDFVSAPGETSDAHGDDRSPAHNHTPDDRDLAYETIASARAFIVWRGAPRSAAEARTQIPLLLRSTVRTAWLAALANEPRLEYFLDSRYQERDWWYRGAVVSVTHAMRTMVIARNPEPFPIRSWMAFVLGQAIPAGGSTIDTPSFGINAVRLLNSADELLRIDPSQSFACSMAAVEAGLGSRGSELGEKIGRRATRLLIPELAGRKGAQELFKRLYNLRSRVVHGDTCAVTPRQAVFMRYVASCVTYALAGFAKAEAMFGNPSSEDAIRKSLDQSEFEPGQPIGTIEPSFLISVLRSDRALSSWVGD